MALNQQAIIGYYRLVARTTGDPMHIERAVRGVHQWFGLDADDPRTTFAWQRFVILAHPWNSEDVAASPIHALLIVATMITVLVSRASRRPSLVGYVAALTVAFGLVCFYVAWTPWNTMVVATTPAISRVEKFAWARADPPMPSPIFGKT